MSSFWQDLYSEFSGVRYSVSFVCLFGSVLPCSEVKDSD